MPRMCVPSGQAWQLGRHQQRIAPARCHDRLAVAQFCRGQRRVRHRGIGRDQRNGHRVPAKGKDVGKHLVPLFVPETLILTDRRCLDRHLLAERLGLGFGLNDTNSPGRALAHAGVAHGASLLPDRAGDHPIFDPLCLHEFEDLERAKIYALAAAGAAACIYLNFRHLSPPVGS